MTESNKISATFFSSKQVVQAKASAKWTYHEGMGLHKKFSVWHTDKTCNKNGLSIDQLQAFAEHQHCEAFNIMGDG